MRGLDVLLQGARRSFNEREREREFVVVDERSMRNVGYNMMERVVCFVCSF